MKTVTVIGAGLAGCEAAYQLAKRGVKCRLYDCKPHKFTPSHKSPGFAELVCSNSLKADDLGTASGLLKQELRLLDSLCISIADQTRVPAGGALAVDRLLFSQRITEKIINESNVEFISEEIYDFDENTPTVIASGPLTLDPLLKALQKRLGAPLHFYDAAAPIISADSIDYEQTFEGSRYNKGDGAYVNCPLDKEQYNEFVQALTAAKTALLKDFESGVFEGCMPVEEMAKRGADSLRFGPLKPVGLCGKDGKRPYAVVQLRRENAQGDMYNIVGFQTNLTFAEQKRVFGIIPALKNAEYLRYGVMHRNSFIDAPKAINSNFQLLKFPGVYIAGQLSGVEGYCESIMSGLIAGISMYRNLAGSQTTSGTGINGTGGKGFFLPPETMSGALCGYLTRENKNFQPMNANFGLLPPLEKPVRDKKERKLKLSGRAIEKLNIAICSF